MKCTFRAPRPDGLNSDGRWLAYASNESGRYEIYIRTFPEAGGKWQVSTPGGSAPPSAECPALCSTFVAIASPARLHAAGRPDTLTIEASAPAALFPTRLATGGNIATAGFQARAQYAVAADGRFLMNVAADDAVASPITIVQNWIVVGLKK